MSGGTGYWHRDGNRADIADRKVCRESAFAIRDWHRHADTCLGADDVYSRRRWAVCLGKSFAQGRAGIPCSAGLGPDRRRSDSRRRAGDPCRRGCQPLTRICRMDTSRFYDDIADLYHLVYADWPASMRRQAEVLDGILQSALGEGPHRILDVSCGIGTQALGLAALRHAVTASDVSVRAIERARREAEQRGLEVKFSIADMRT